MRARVLGATAILFGLGGIGLCVYALIEMPKLAVRVPVADAPTWKLHWLSSYLTIGVAAIFLFIGGRYILHRKRLGYVLVAAASIVLASFPWLIQATGIDRYAFERPRVWTTAVMVALAVAALVALGRRPRDS